MDSASTSAFLSAALLVDNSGSLSDAQFTALLNASRALLTGMEEADRVSLLTVNDRIAAPLGSGAPPSAVAGALDGLRRQMTSRTPLWDAVAAGASMIVGDSGTRIVFVASDGGDNESWLTREAVEQALTRSGIALDWFATKYKSRSYHYSPDDKYGAVSGPMEQLTLRTGGQTFQANASNLKRLLAQRLEDLRSSYILTYTPTGVAHDDGWHKLEVKLKNSKGDVRARPGYFVMKQ